MQKLLSSDESVERYLDCLKQAHDQFLATNILEGKQFTKMVQNPLHSSDISYGVPTLFNDMLDQIIEEEEQEEEGPYVEEETDENLRTGFSSLQQQESFNKRVAHHFAQSYAGNDGGTGFYGEGQDTPNDTELPEGVKHVFMALDSEEEEEKKVSKAHARKSRRPVYDNKIIGLSPMVSGRGVEPDNSQMLQDSNFLSAVQQELSASNFMASAEESLQQLEETEVDRQQKRVVGMVAQR